MRWPTIAIRYRRLRGLRHAVVLAVTSVVDLGSASRARCGRCSVCSTTRSVCPARASGSAGIRSSAWCRGSATSLTALLSCAIIVQAHQHAGAARRAAPDADQRRRSTSLIGVVPFVGDVADVFWKSNTRNLALLERHAARAAPADGRSTGCSCRHARARLLLDCDRCRCVVMYWLARMPLGSAGRSC